MSNRDGSHREPAGALNSFFGFFGHSFYVFSREAKRFVRLALDALDWSIIAPFTGRGMRWKSVLRHMVVVGFNSIPIVSFICGLVGAIMAMQSAYQLRKFGGLLYVPPLVGVGMTRELGPLIAAIIMAGRSGSAFAAEIGTMVVSEEVDALESMALHPTKFLVVPKVVSMTFMQPCLTLIADLAGIIGGLIVALYALDMTYHQYYGYMVDFMLLKDIFTGLIKSVAFGIIIALVGCYYGFSVTGGAEGVGRVTTSSVVTSIFLIIVADLLFTSIFYFAFSSAP
jgi:phospholipid/cholesterol/gamma-HCH transport system permease protein